MPHFSNQQLKKPHNNPMTSPSRWYPIVILILAGIGFADATYLTVEHYTTFSLPCTITSGCEIVTNSAYSLILGVPVALLGAIYYLSMFLATYCILEFSAKHLLKYVAVVTTTGAAFSLWFIYVQLVLLQAICQYCMVSAATSLSLFALSLVYLWQSRTHSSAAHHEH